MYRRRSRTPIVIILVLLILVVIVGAVGYWMVRRTFPQTEGALRLPGLQADVHVYRDSMGVPHLYAANLHDLFMAQGFVHAQDRFWQMEFWRRIGSGRLAEVLGPSALDSDRFIRTLGWHRTAAVELEQLGPENRGVLEAYAEGVNAYLASTDISELSLEFTLLDLTGVDFTPEAWSPINTLTWAKVMAWDLGGNMPNELTHAEIVSTLGAAALETVAPGYGAGQPVIVPHPITGATLRAVPEAAFSAGRILGVGDDLGSNSWVIAGSRTETGSPILANDPHLGIQMPSIWYEIGLHCDPVTPECPIEVVGSSFAGAPGVIIGHNARIAWGLTNLGPDVQDLFVERINPENPNQVEYQGRWEDMELIREEIAVAGEDEPVVLFARLTRHGPIINDVLEGVEEDWSYGWEPLALSWTALQPGTLMQSVMLLDRASNWDEFRNALSYWDVPSQNFVYADVDGNIGYQAPGRIPIRARGDGSMPVPGWTGEYEWTGTIPFNELPRAFNPQEGYIVTANNAVVSPGFPYFLGMDWDPGYRARRIAALIEADPALSVADILAIQTDSAPAWAEEVLPYVVELSTPDPRLSQAIGALRGWDGRANRDSTGATLFEVFRLHLVRETFADDLGEHLFRRSQTSLMTSLTSLLADPTSTWFDNRYTPETEDRDAILLASLEDAINELSERLGNDMGRWRWGELHTATFENQSLGRSGIRPIELIFNRGPVEVDGTIATVNNTGYDPNDPFSVIVVPSYRQVIDVADFTRSVSVHTTGQSGHAFAPHYNDMIPMWRDGRYHPMMWARADIEAGAEAHLVLTP
jgi:penicillin amidase